ncbi:MAG: site-specific DNA-methyltransferase [Thermoguttaceae bacterium]|nr:site-specific DNA-methyltransferase [Thermoguttaceae bacterium]
MGALSRADVANDEEQSGDDRALPLELAEYDLSAFAFGANLLRDDGVIFISIDDREVCNLRKICDEIFGEENFVAQVTVVGNPRGRDYGGIARMHDYLLAYQKTSEAQLNLIEDEDNEFKMFDAIGGFELRELRNRNIKFNKENRPNLYYPFYIDPDTEDANGLHPISLTPNDGWLELYPLESQGVNTVWRWGKEKAKANLNINILAKPMRNGGYMIVEKYRESRVMARSVWGNQKTNTERGTLLVKELFGAKVFDYPKPLEMLKQICELGSGSDGDDIILDFFSGSATTAHAVMELNAEDGGARRFILVQLPELCAEGSEAAKAGYRNICEIGKERMRRAGAKIREERAVGLLEDDAASLDVGFKVFRLDTSNWELWDDSPTPPTEAAAFLARLRDSKNARKLDRSDADVLTEVALKSGLPLDATFEALPLVNVAVYVERGARLGAILQDGAEVEDVERLLEAPPSERLEKIVVAESAFRSDAALANVAHLLAENGIEAKFI